MKKVLLGTSAIALVGAMSAPASAAEWDVKVGGYMTQHVAYANNDVDLVSGTGATASGSFAGLSISSGGEYDGIDSKQDAEVHFLPSITLDNGIKIGANIQLEAASTGDQIDESYMYIRGSFGELNLGSENSAGYKMHYAAPDVSNVGVNSGSTTAFVPWSGAGAGADVFRGTLGSTYIENLRNNDAQRITYYTPRFAGFQVGASYARDGFQDTNAQVDCDATTCDFFDFGANYVNSFGDFNVAISGQYGFANANGGSDPQIWSLGANLGFAGFTLGGSYADQDNGGVVDGHAWDAGVSYETGPWGFSVTYFHGENFDNDCLGVGTAATTNNCIGNSDEEVDQYMLGISYALAQGVGLHAFGGYVDFDGARITGGEDSARADVDGWFIGTNIGISF